MTKFLANSPILIIIYGIGVYSTFTGWDPSPLNMRFGITECAFSAGNMGLGVSEWVFSLLNVFLVGVKWIHGNKEPTFGKSGMDFLNMKPVF